MKEAAGEANMTVITIILIGIVLTVGYGLITTLMEKVQKRSTEDIEQYDTKNPIGAYVVDYNFYM